MFLVNYLDLHFPNNTFIYSFIELDGSFRDNHGALQRVCLELNNDPPYLNISNFYSSTFKKHSFIDDDTFFHVLKLAIVNVINSTWPDNCLYLKHNLLTIACNNFANVAFKRSKVIFIQRCFRNALYNPQFTLCKKRLLKEFNELTFSIDTL